MKQAADKSLEGSPSASRAEPRNSRDTDQIHQDLMQAVREGCYLPGVQLPNERQLAEHFGTTRQQIRNVLLLMQQAGLIKRKVGSGTYLAEDAPQIIERLDAEVDVHAKHEHSLLETIEARLVFEPGVAAMAARNATEEDLAAIRMALESIRAPSSWLEFKSRIYMFARAYYVASGNTFLLWTFDQILKARRAHKFDGHRESGGVAEIVRRHAYVQLEEICEAIAAGDEQRAEAVTKNYLIGIAASSGLN